MRKRFWNTYYMKVKENGRRWDDLNGRGKENVGERDNKS